MLYVAFLLFLLLLRHLRLKVRQLHLLLPSQPLPLRQRLQQRNPGGSNLSRVGPRRVCILLFLQLLRLRLELHQLRLLLLSQRPLRNPIGSSLYRLAILRVSFLRLLPPLRHLRPERRQVRRLPLGQRPSPRQLLQLRNPIGFGLSRLATLRDPIVLFLPLLHLRPKLRQLRAPQSAATAAPTPPTPQSGGQPPFPPGTDPPPFPSFSAAAAPWPKRRPAPLSAPQSAAPAPPTPPTPRTPGNSPNNSGCVHLPPLTPPRTLGNLSPRTLVSLPPRTPRTRAGSLPHLPGHTAPTFRTRHLGGQPGTPARYPAHPPHLAHRHPRTQHHPPDHHQARTTAVARHPTPNVAPEPSPTPASPPHPATPHQTTTPLRLDSAESPTSGPTNVRGLYPPRTIHPAANSPPPDQPPCLAPSISRRRSHADHCRTGIPPVSRIVSVADLIVARYCFAFFSFFFCFCCATFGRSSDNSTACSTVNGPRSANASNTATRSATARSSASSATCSTASGPHSFNASNSAIRAAATFLALRYFALHSFLFSHFCAFGWSSANSATCSTVSGPHSFNASNSATRSTAALPTLLGCLIRRREHPTPTITRTPRNSPNSSGRVHLPPLTAPRTLPSLLPRTLASLPPRPLRALPAGFARHRPGHTTPTFRTRHHGPQPRNTGDSSLSHLVPLRLPYLPFLLLLRLRPKLRQLHLLLVSQRPLLRQRL